MWYEEYGVSNPFYANDSVALINGDSQVELRKLKENSVDLVFTDPPYLKEYLYTYEYLANECPRIMKRSASLVTIVGHYALPDVIKIFDGKLKFRWILCMDQTEGVHPRMAMGIEVMWKPMLWYVKGAYPSGRGFLRDKVSIKPQEKKFHKWQQSTDWAEYYIKRLCPSGGVVLDPFFGSGTVGVVAARLGFKCIGIEIDKDSCNESVKRLDK